MTEDIVLLSDSVTYGALALLEDSSGVSDLTSNQAMGVAGNYFLLRRRIASGAPLKQVVYIIHPRSYVIDHKQFPDLNESYFTTVFDAEDEIQDVETLLGRPDLAQQMIDSRDSRAAGIPSQNRRGVVQEPLILALRGLKVRLRGDFVQPGAQDRIREYAEIRSFTLSEPSRIFMDRMIQLTQQHNIRLKLFPPPLPQTVLNTWKISGYWEQYIGYMTKLAGRWPHVEFTEDTGFQTTKDQHFTDGLHLTATVRRQWGQHVFELITR